MYIQKNLTTTQYPIPDVAFELPDALWPKFKQFGGFSKLVFDDSGTQIVDIVEDADKRADYDAMLAEEERQRAEDDAARARQAEEAALRSLGMHTMMQLMFRASAPDMQPDDVIRCRALADAWESGTHAAGEVRTVDGYPYRCRKDHDTAVYPDVVPGGTAWAAYWVPYHGTTPETALPYIEPTGEDDMYKAGECMIWQPEVMLLDTDSVPKFTMRAERDTSFGPADDPDAWTEVD